jgi:phthiocerol/phenolphthiocerol synthesis type-I polyketide synthase E
VAGLPQRVAGLSPERRRLLDRLLARAEAPKPQLVDAEPATSNTEGSAATTPHKAECQRLYDSLNQRLDASVFGPFAMFLNFGYVPDGNPSYSVIELPEHCLNKNSVRLALEVIGDCDLGGRRVLDIGCGRGGTVSTITQFFEPKSVCGLDLSPAAIAFCRSTHRHERISFCVGDAERLIFDDESFDVVLNIESSQSYGDIHAFYRQVFRVLAPGGHFLYTDVMSVGRFAECGLSLQRAGFIREQDRDITPNVLRSCDEIAGYRMRAYGETERDETMEDFLGTPGSRFYEAMKGGAWTYRIQRWKKGAAGPAAGSEGMVTSCGQ